MYGDRGRGRRILDGSVKSSGLVNKRMPRVRNKVDARMPFGKALIILTTKSLWEYLKPSVPWLLTYWHTLAFLAVRYNKQRNNIYPDNVQKQYPILFFFALLCK